MARSTYKTFLMYNSGTGSSYQKLVDIKDYPDLGGEPEMIETTTLSDKMHTYVEGVQSLDGLTFTANYDKTDYAKVKALEGSEHDFAVWFGGDGEGENLTPTGVEGKFKFSGTISVYVSGGGVNEATNMNITIAPSTVIEPDEA